jgi:hypothetical protein
MQSLNGLEESFEDSREKLLQPTRSGCFVYVTKAVWGTFSAPTMK